jgi:hypothetical protein
MGLPPFPTDELLKMDSRSKWRAFMVLSFLSHVGFSVTLQLEIYMPKLLLI